MAGTRAATSRSVARWAKSDRDFVHHPILTDGERYSRHPPVWRKGPADEMIPIEFAYAFPARAPAMVGNVIEMASSRHRRHGGI
jgi:hypothetical protein